MEKLVLILNKSATDGSAIASEVDALPGIFVTGFSRSLVDIEAAAPEAVEMLRGYALSHGFDLEQVSQPSLIEPVSPFSKTAGGPGKPTPSREQDGEG